MKSDLIQKIRSALGLSASEISRIIARAPHTYKVYQIPKRSGGMRTIAQPARETKLIQRWLTENILHELPIHQSATAYKLGASIKQNAYAHVNSKYLVKFDFKNFFPSIRSSDIFKFLTVHFSERYTPDEIANITLALSFKNKLTGELGLSIGAPTSPLISNAFLHPFDSIIGNWSIAHGFTYTRYADDLTFSTNTPGICSIVEPKILDALAELEFGNLRLNDDKRTHLSKKHCRRITGLVISSQDKISLGRDRKREISVMLHHFLVGTLSPEKALKLQGLLGFARDVEPTFVLSMDRKYGNELLNRVFTLRIDSTEITGSPIANPA